MSAARSRLQRFAWLSVATAVGTISLKTVAWQWTGSVGLLADALESIVNLAAALATVGAIIVAARPPDDDHAYGHDKVEFFASGFEGALILTAALGIFIAAIHRVVEPAPLSGLTFGLVVSALASALNLITARILLRAGQRHRSPALSADGHHLMTDVWSSCGVLLGQLTRGRPGGRLGGPHLPADDHDRGDLPGWPAALFRHRVQRRLLP